MFIFEASSLVIIKSMKLFISLTIYMESLYENCRVSKRLTVAVWRSFRFQCLNGMLKIVDDVESTVDF